ncbi:MAG: zinc-binding dehydrogenase [Sphingomonadales bacterium]|nr:zinc-binding dehydrogenase [Sphingomonadales bacterium]
MATTQPAGRLSAPRVISIETVPVPALEPGDALIEVACVGICGTDLAMWRHGPPVAGAVLGHEFAGRIVATGGPITGVRIGDRVTVNPMADLIGLGRVPGAFAAQVRLPAATPGRNLFGLPDTLDDEAAAMAEPLAVALHAVARGETRPDDKVVVFGLGPIGLSVIACLRAMGVSRVIAVDPSPLRRDLGMRMGALAVHDPAEALPQAFAGEWFGTWSVPYEAQALASADLVFDCAGSGHALAAGVRSLARDGRLVIVADPHEQPLADLRLVMLHELRVSGALAYDTEFAAAIDLLARGAIDLSPLVTHRFALADLGAAFAMQADPFAAVKVLVKP